MFSAEQDLALFHQRHDALLARAERSRMLRQARQDRRLLPVARPRVDLTLLRDRLLARLRPADLAGCPPVACC